MHSDPDERQVRGMLGCPAAELREGRGQGQWELCRAWQDSRVWARRRKTTARQWEAWQLGGERFLSTPAQAAVLPLGLQAPTSVGFFFFFFFEQ